jgi:hypothetical protein
MSNQPFAGQLIVSAFPVVVAGTSAGVLSPRKYPIRGSVMPHSVPLTRNTQYRKAGMFPPEAVLLGLADASLYPPEIAVATTDASVSPPAVQPFPLTSFADTSAQTLFPVVEVSGVQEDETNAS